MSALYAIDSPTYHKIPLKRDVLLINHKWRKYARVIKDCNDLYHTDDWTVVQRCEIPCNYNKVVASFDDGDRFLN